MNTAKTVEHDLAYHAGYAAKLREIDDMGWEAARDKFNLDYPHDSRLCSMTSWHYAKGEIYALLASK